MRSILQIAVLCALVLGAAACSGGLEKAVIGKYAIDVDTSKMDASLKPMADMMKGEASKITMELMEGGKAKLAAPNDTISGTWKLEGTTLTVTAESGKGKDQPGTFEVKDGGKTLVPKDDTMKMGDVKGAVITFKKQEG